MRFMTAFYAATPGVSVTLDGCQRMRERPIKPLVDALASLGADISYTGVEGFPPLKIEGRRLRGGDIHIDASVSSQFISALLMVAPTMESPLVLHLDGDRVSTPYIKMTVEMMRTRGIAIDTDRNTVTVTPSPYRPVCETVEHDWSAAAFWYEIAALTAGWVTLNGLHAHSLQGDSVLAEIGPRFGTVTEWEGDNAELSATPDLYSRLDLDMSDTPDLVQPLAVTACAVGMPFRFTGVSTLRSKETDRIDALCRELHKAGCMVEAEGDTAIAWDGRRMPLQEIPVIDTYGDHRMAMSFAPLAVFLPGIVIRGIETVDKSYPAFWDDLRAAGFTLTDASQPL